MRIEVNSSIMGLLAGSQMAIHLLKLTDGSDHLLAEVFPKIPQIHRFNLKTNAAQEVLESAENHLSAMAIPYILAVHEDYMKSCLKLVEEYCHSDLKSDDIKASRQHEVLQAQGSRKFSTYSLEQFHMLRLMRNCMIHTGGDINKALEKHCRGCSVGAKRGWEKLTGYSPDFHVGGAGLRLSQYECIAALAITKNLARQTNIILQDVIDRSAWGEIMMHDIWTYGPGLPKNPSERTRKIRGYARHHYMVLGFSDSEIEAFSSS
jgi:hypothetical protein